MVAILPAGLVLPGAGGTIWVGNAPLKAGHQADWRWSPLGSVMGLGFAVDWHVSGAESDLSGRALLRPGLMRVEAVKGAVEGALPFAYAPNLPFACDFLGRLDLEQAEAVTASGTMRTAAGRCHALSGDAAGQAVPPLTFSFSAMPGGGTAIRASSDGAEDLLMGAITPEGQLRYRLSAVGARLLPFAAPPGGAGTEVELDL